MMYAVGDEVGFCRRHSWSGTLLRYGFSHVTKINRWGHITLANGKVFDKNGNERGEFADLHLVSAERLRGELAAELAQRARNSVANEICKLLAGQRNGFGNYCEISDATRDRLHELVNQL